MRRITNGRDIPFRTFRIISNDEWNYRISSLPERIREWEPAVPLIVVVQPGAPGSRSGFSTLTRPLSTTTSRMPLEPKPGPPPLSLQILWGFSIDTLLCLPAVSAR